VDAFEFGGVDHARGVAADHEAFARHFGHGVPAAFGQGLGAVAEHFAAFEDLLDEGVRFEFAEVFVRVHLRVFGVERGDHAHGHHVILHVVHEAAAECFVVEGEAHGVHDLATVHAAFGHFPDFLATRGVDHGVDILQVEFLDELLGHGAARAFAQDGDFGLEIHAGLEIALGRSVGVHALVAAAHAHDFVAFEQHFLSAERGVYILFEFREFVAHPLDDFAQGHDVVAVVDHGGRGDGQFARARGCELHDFVDVGFVFERGFLFAVGEEFLQGHGVHDRARDGVSAHHAAFFNDDHGHVHFHAFLVDALALLGAVVDGCVVCIDHLHELDGRAHARWAGAHNAYAACHHIAFDFF